MPKTPQLPRVVMVEGDVVIYRRPHFTFYIYTFYMCVCVNIYMCVLYTISELVYNIFSFLPSLLYKINKQIKPKNNGGLVDFSLLT